MDDIIRSKGNRKIKLLRSLGNAKGRKKEGKFFAEGPVVLEEILPYIKPLEVLAGDREYREYKDLLETFEDEKIPVTRVSSEILSQALPTKHSQGLVGIFPFLPEDIELPRSGPVLYLDGIRDPGNLGGIFRSANAFGVEKIILSPDCVDIYNDKVVRSTMAALFRVPFQISDSSVLKDLKNKGFRVCALDVRGEETSDFCDEDKVVFLAGNEANGLRNDVIELADLFWRIPMEPEVESLNVNVATSICLYEYYRERKNRR